MSGFIVDNGTESTITDNPLTSTATTINVANGSDFPSTFPYRMTLWDKTANPDPADDTGMEIVHVTGRTTNALTVTRGQESTSGVEHPTGENIAMLITAGLFNDATYGIQPAVDLNTAKNTYPSADSIKLGTIEENAEANNISDANATDLTDAGSTILHNHNAIVTLTANTTLTSAHVTVLINATTASITITLPAASSNSGRIYNIKKIDSSVNVVTIDGNASETIDGATTKTISSQWDSLSIQCNGTEWYVI